MLLRWLDYLSARPPASHDSRIIPQTPISNIKNVAYNAERWSLLLDRCSERRAVVLSCRLHVNGPAGIDVARIQIKREDKMLYGRATVGCGHCVKKKRARSEVDNRRAGDAHDTKTGAWQISCQHGAPRFRCQMMLPSTASSA